MLNPPQPFPLGTRRHPSAYTEEGRQGNPQHFGTTAPQCSQQDMFLHVYLRLFVVKES